ncbi:MAG TPA: cupin domain-containing protein [Acidimicrobiales bacterium]|nr:cupin domain-containing protein [Acidimicrobiales bacterium]
MRILELGTSRSKVIQWFGSVGVSIGPLARTEEAEVVRVSIATIAPGGQIGRHATPAWQLFYVTEGSGWVAGETGEMVPMSAGMAASWKPGEEHGAGSHEGLVACIVEASVNPVAHFLERA